MENIILVLGAGSNCFLGFPTGKGLKRRILTRDISLFVQPCSEGLLNIKQPSDVEDFYQALRDFRSPSVDLFASRYPEYAEMCRYASYYLIRDAEQQSIVKFREDCDWYDYLFNHFIHKSSVDDIEFPVIITFNYDRSLEYYLFGAIKSAYNLNIEKTTEVMNRLKIIHIHGSLGPLPWQSLNEPVPYGGLIRRDKPAKLTWDVEEALLNLQYLSFIDEYSQLQSTIDKAENLIYLGFGFSKENMQILQGMGIEPSKAGRSAIGTGFGFKPAEKDNIERKYQHLTVAESNEDCLELFRNRYEVQAAFTGDYYREPGLTVVSLDPEHWD